MQEIEDAKLAMSIIERTSKKLPTNWAEKKNVFNEKSFIFGRNGLERRKMVSWKQTAVIISTEKASDDGWALFFCDVCKWIDKELKIRHSLYWYFGVIDIPLWLYNQPSVRLKQVHLRCLFNRSLSLVRGKVNDWLCAPCVCLYLFVAHYCAIRSPYLPMLRESYVRTCNFYQSTTIRLAFMSCRFRNAVTQSEISH